LGVPGLNRRGRGGRQVGDQIRGGDAARVDRPQVWHAVTVESINPAGTGAARAGNLNAGEIPILHATAVNANAIRLYQSLGFTLRRDTAFTAFQRP
jgi:hypothetical protein